MVICLLKIYRVELANPIFHLIGSLVMHKVPGHQNIHMECVETTRKETLHGHSKTFLLKVLLTTLIMGLLLLYARAVG